MAQSGPFGLRVHLSALILAALLGAPDAAWWDILLMLTFHRPPPHPSQATIEFQQTLNPGGGGAALIKFLHSSFCLILFIEHPSWVNQA